MQMKSPITVIKNLFNNYADKECVSAVEYNGNISALKADIQRLYLKICLTVCIKQTPI